MSDRKSYLTLKEVASELRFPSAAALRRQLIRPGLLPVVRVTPRKQLVSAAALSAFIAAHGGRP